MSTLPNDETTYIEIDPDGLEKHFEQLEASELADAFEIADDSEALDVCKLEAGDTLAIVLGPGTVEHDLAELSAQLEQLGVRALVFPHGTRVVVVR